MAEVGALSSQARSQPGRSGFGVFIPWAPPQGSALSQLTKSRRLRKWNCFGPPLMLGGSPFIHSRQPLEKGIDRATPVVYMIICREIENDRFRISWSPMGGWVTHLTQAGPASEVMG